MPPTLELVGASLLGSWLSGAASPATGSSWAIWAFAVASVGFIALLSCVAIVWLSKKVMGGAASAEAAH